MQRELKAPSAKKIAKQLYKARYVRVDQYYWLEPKGRSGGFIAFLEHGEMPTRQANDGTIPMHSKERICSKRNEIQDQGR